MTPNPKTGSALTSPRRGEVGAQRRVRGKRSATNTVAKSRALRRNETEAEQKFWNIVRNRQIDNHKFVRQFPIGPYFADFVCRKESLIVELDGGQHNENTHDIHRTTFLNSQGYAVLRFWNNEILENLEGCHAALTNVLGGSPSPDLRFAPATLSPQGRGEEPALNAQHRKA